VQILLYLVSSICARAHMFSVDIAQVCNTPLLLELIRSKRPYLM
jgi:hypothetical protein